MHGRQRKERTAEEEVARKKEQVKKVTAYRYAMDLILSKRSKNELDEELIKVTAQVLASNPDIGTLWNIRKEAFTVLKQQKLVKIEIPNYDEFCNSILPKELEFTEFCLKNNPKSYGAWHHRVWLMRETNFSKVESELKLCAKYLEYDDRNFHVWDYRRFLQANSKEATLEQELEFTTEKISSNFSNFSSWHLRSKVLPKLNRDFLQEELELIRNAVFTDPKDQSAWFYHRWLLKSQLQPENPFLIGSQLAGSKLLLIFSSNVPSPQQLDLKVSTEGSNSLNQDELIWSNPWNNTCSKLWELALPKGVSSVVISSSKNIMKQFDLPELRLIEGEIKKKIPAHFDVETQGKSEKLMTLLKEEIEWVQELQELEPDIKWPISTLIMLMRMIDFVGYKPDILKNLDLLIKLDSKRINYYLDLRSKYLIEWQLIQNMKASAAPGLEENLLDLSGLNLTALYYPERMCFHRKIKLSNNALKNCEPFRALRNCNDLDIAANKLAESDIRSALVGLQRLKL